MTKFLLGLATLLMMNMAMSTEITLPDSITVDHPTHGGNLFLAVSSWERIKYFEEEYAPLISTRAAKLCSLMGYETVASFKLGYSKSTLPLMVIDSKGNLSERQELALFAVNTKAVPFAFFAMISCRK